MASIKGMNLDHLVGQEVGTATLLREHARGGMAAVFVAYQRTLKRQIAVKILPKSLVTPKAAESFQQEAETAAILSHPNIVQIYEVGDTGEFLYFTMQLIHGRSLSEYIKAARKHVLPSKRVLPIKPTLNIIIQVLDALGYAHSQEIIHRDIKPANILIETHTKRPIITDFGIARILRGPEIKSDTVQGTPIYMAPEQAVTQKVTPKVDIYATGLMLFEMICSRLPLPRFGSAEKLLRMKLSLKDRLYQKKPSELNPAVDSDLEAVVLKAIAFSLEERFSTCGEFKDRLQICLENIIKKG
jgi:serine/threonine-protein kinase